MKKEDQVCSFEQAREFERRNIFFDTEKVWVLNRRKDSPVLMTKEEFFNLLQPYAGFIAPNVAELGDIFIRTGFGNALPYKNKDNGDKWEMPDLLYEADSTLTEAQARADAFIWLIKNGFVNPKKLKL